MVAGVLLAGLAAVFATRAPAPLDSWTTRAAPVLQYLLGDVASISRSASVSPSQIDVLGEHLAEARRLGNPTDPTERRLWAEAIDDVNQVYAGLSRPGPDRQLVGAQLTSAGELLLQLAVQH